MIESKVGSLELMTTRKIHENKMASRLVYYAKDICEEFSEKVAKY